VAACPGSGGGQLGDLLLITVLALGRVRFQPHLGLPQPGQPPGRVGQRGRELVTAGLAMLAVLALVGLGRLPQDLGDLGLDLVQVRLALLAATLVPSSAMSPRRIRPAAEHSRTDWTSSSARAATWRTRNRAIVTWSGELLPASTRKARSSRQRRSICREERTPTA
jgi:hypothetical protein